MIIKYMKFSVLAIVLTMTSCDSEMETATQVQKVNTKSGGLSLRVVNGRITFNDKEEIASVFRKLTESEDEVLAESLNPLYKQGFTSLIPVMTEENEQMLFDLYNNIVPENKKYENKFDVFEQHIEKVIGDEVFASLLNFKGEIGIGTSVYKYTDAGLFVLKGNDTRELEETLIRYKISPQPAVPSDQAAVERFLAMTPCDGIYSISTSIDFIPTNSNCGGGGGGYSGGGSTTPTPGSPASSDPSYNTFLNNLSSCSPVSGLFGSLFGDNNVCIDKYESRRRVKTKAFNYNYFVVYHMGVKVHHQYRGWTGFWRTEKTDEIRLVVEAAQFEYDANKLLNNAIINNASAVKQFYSANQKITYGPNNMNINGYTYTNLTSLPQVFQDDLSFEFFSTGWSWLDNQIQNGIDSNLKASALNSYFYDALYNQVKGHMQAAKGSQYQVPDNRTFAAKFPENGKVIIQKALVKKGFNLGIREQTFDWGAEFSFGYSENNNGSWSMSGGAGNQLIRPKHFRVKMIGASRRGSGWHGSKFTVGMN